MRLSKLKRINRSTHPTSAVRLLISYCLAAFIHFTRLEAYQYLKRETLSV